MNKYSVVKKPADILQETARKAKVLRKRLGYSQKELAERSDVSLGSIRRFEQSGQISFESLLKIALILNRLTDFESVFTILVNQERVERLFE